VQLYSATGHVLHLGVVTDSCKFVVRIIEVNKKTPGSPGTKGKYDITINNR
jgi:hypothetical protein